MIKEEFDDIKEMITVFFEEERNTEYSKGYVDALYLWNLLTQNEYSELYNLITDKEMEKLKLKQR